MICVFRYLGVTVYIQLFSFRAARVLINSVQFSPRTIRVHCVYVIMRFLCLTSGINGTTAAVIINN